MDGCSSYLAPRRPCRGWAELSPTTARLAAARDRVHAEQQKAGPSGRAGLRPARALFEGSYTGNIPKTMPVRKYTSTVMTTSPMRWSQKPVRSMSVMLSLPEP